MKGTFKITLDYLRELGACAEGRREFKRVFPNGGEYQEVLDRCADEGRLDFARWLFSKIGPTEDVRIFENPISDNGKNIFFAGRIEFKFSALIRSVFSGCGINAGEGIKAGWGINAGEGIEAGEGINAGEGIKAGWGINAGEGFGIYAGLRIKISLWAEFAIVSANGKPKNLISGHWKEE